MKLDALKGEWDDRIKKEKEATAEDESIYEGWLA